MKNQISSKNPKKPDRERYHDDGVVQVLVVGCLASLIVI
jgi:hypothetical protein